MSEFKDSMLASVSHELRTPINCIDFMLNSVEEKFIENGDH